MQPSLTRLDSFLYGRKKTEAAWPSIAGACHHLSSLFCSLTNTTGAFILQSLHSASFVRLHVLAWKESMGLARFDVQSKFLKWFISSRTFCYSIQIRIIILGIYILGIPFPPRGLKLPPVSFACAAPRKSRAQQKKSKKSKAKGIVYLPVEAAYQVSTLNRDHIPNKYFIYAHSTAYLLLCHPVSFITHHVPKPPRLHLYSLFSPQIILAC